MIIVRKSRQVHQQHSMPWTQLIGHIYLSIMPKLANRYICNIIHIYNPLNKNLNFLSFWRWWVRNKTSIQNNTGCSIFHGSERREEHAERRQRCMQRNATGRGSEEKKQVMELSHLQVTCLPVAGHLVGMIDKRALFLTARFACNLLSRPKKNQSALQWSARSQQDL